MLALGSIAVAVAIAVSSGGPGASVAAGQSAAPVVVPQTDDAVPARNVTMLGASPEEAPGETWGIGQGNSEGSEAWQLVRYTTDNGWTTAPPFETASGEPLTGFQPANSPGSKAGEKIHDLAGSFAPDGAGALLGFVPEGERQRRILLVREPGGAFRETPEVPESMLNPATESLYSEYRATMLAAVEEPGGKAGAFVVPPRTVAAGPENGVLHWNGTSWSREPIELPAEAEPLGFRVLSIAVASPSDAWLLAQISSHGNKVALFRRVGSGTEAEWKPVLFGGRATLDIPTQGGEEPFAALGVGSPPSNANAALTATTEGVWIDGQRGETRNAATMYLKSEGSGASGHVLASWCTARESEPPCTYPLPEALPTGPYRTFAWPSTNGAEPYGSRVITGLTEGASLRLEGSEFRLQLALGSGFPPDDDVGVTLGAAFSSAVEGWLGSFRMPVNLTEHPAPDRVEEYPVPFRKALTAVAPAPGQPVGALSSEALAVGDEGEVARYKPGAGWMPESLYGTNAVISRARLRAVAWPKPNRAYAVGEFGQMWLWRGETGLWEPDPAEPQNFRGNLMGIAFQPGDPTRGFAVGQGGVLLRYGKTWQQLPNCSGTEVGECIPAAAEGASFTSIAFAGSQAIVAFRQFHRPQGSSGDYTGGLLINNGGGWQVDGRAAEALGGYIPWAVGALSDGGAAMSATKGGGSGEGPPVVLERESLDAPWQPTAQSYPGFEAPGSLALFRENGKVRVLASGGLPDTRRIDEVEVAPPGFPETLVQPYPLATGFLIRQTSDGWSDQEHNHNEVGAPYANFSKYDMAYNGDPTSAAMINETGTEGWTVGGVVDPEGGFGDTADIGRYPADGGTPPGVGTSQVKTDPHDATLAIGGGAQCAAPCALRADAGIGPDVWLQSAVALAARTPGVRAFIDTGPRVSAGQTSGPPFGVALLGINYPRELGNYAELLDTSLPTFAAAASTEATSTQSECPLREAFSTFSAPFGEAPAAQGITPLGASTEGCEGGEASYYAFEANSRAGSAASGGGTAPAGPVRVIVLDDSHEGETDATQLTWTAHELQAAKAAGVPAVVVGNAYLQKQIASGDSAAISLARVLVANGASAYFFDAPEENIELPLYSGSESIPSFGSGTLGYMLRAGSESPSFDGHAGFLLAQVEVSGRNPKTNRAPVSARLIPNVGELAMEAKDGLLIRRSHAALFTGLARRPRAGGVASGTSTKSEDEEYIPIPANCVGATCANAILPEYEFTSSKPDIGSFVEPNLKSAETNAVLLGGAGEKPIPDSASGLFCAYNPGTTTVTISSGGLSASMNVTVQAGSVRRPCGTTRDTELSTNGVPTNVENEPKTSPEASTPLSLTLPPAPAVPAIPAKVPPTPRPAPFVPLAGVPAVPLAALVPPPLPAAGQPTPPSGTSAVTQPVAQNEEEEEEATESVSNQATAYRESEFEPPSALIIGLLLIAALAGVGGVRGRRRRRGEPRVAVATISAMRRERLTTRAARRDRTRPWM